MNLLPLGAAGIFAVLGTLHLIYTLSDMFGRPRYFVPRDAALLEAMRTGGFLYVEEFNRAPEDTLNTLLTAMAERRIAVPRAGTVEALPTFRVIASMNPYDRIGTTRLSTSVHDRICRLAMGYQDAAAERGIVALRAPLPSVAPELYQRLAGDAVAVTRATRQHPDIRQGSSVRGSIRCCASRLRG